MYKFQLTIQQKLLKVLQCIQDEYMTLPNFLEELFKSDDAVVMQWTGVFHENQGAEQVLKIWDSKLQGRKWEESFINSAIDVIINLSQISSRMFYTS
jgi:hypothetical protein